MRAGCELTPDGTPVVKSRQEFDLLVRGLREHGYTAISSRRNEGGVTVGLMRTFEEAPQFLSLRIGSRIPLPETKGLFLVFLGPDGVGKTTTVDQVMASLKPVFTSESLFHWRPQVLKPRSSADEASGKETWTSINRHGDPPRSLMLSLLRLAGVFADYYIGQLKLIAPALNRGELVVFDRYYHDILVDSRRYRYGGPEWLLHLLKHALPQRQALFVVLDAEDNVILSRKQEVTIEELRRQRQRYAELADTLPGCISVRTDIGQQQTVQQVLKSVGVHLAKRFEERFTSPANAAAQAALSGEIQPERRLA
jgi:thymidylate kinase